ncbi:MAG: LON peptidase substrate-binding domain-containing protein [Planctomycetes bacterium]|nr:LON peptidase substrate-binding domain-containing protein [Planctomycetota bacterium]
MRPPGQMPLFPLPDHVLLPGVPAPYRVFEPRYRALVRDLLEIAPEQRWLAMPRLAMGWEADYADSPAFLPMASASLVTRIEPAADGQFHILVLGQVRVRLTEIPSSRPYRLASAEVVDDLTAAGEDATASMRRLLGHLTALGDRIDLPPEECARLLAAEDGHAQLVDRLASLLLAKADDRQDVLESRYLPQRIAIIERTLARFSEKQQSIGDRWKPSAN